MRGHLTCSVEVGAGESPVPLVVLAGQVVSHLLLHDVGRGARSDAQDPPGPVARIFGVGRAEPRTIQVLGGRCIPLVHHLVGEEEHDRLGHGERIAGEEGGNLALVHRITSDPG